MTERLVCIVCPIGCELTVDAADGEVLIEGNECPRGVDYAVSEMTDPRRTLATTLPVLNGVDILVPVRVNAVPRGYLPEAMRFLRQMVLEAPVNGGSEVGAFTLNGEEFKVFATGTVPAK